jgi:hypothetical protein
MADKAVENLQIASTNLNLLINMRRFFTRTSVFAFFFCLVHSVSNGQGVGLPKQTDRWAIRPDGSIAWNIKKNLPHTDHIEMAGEKVAINMG